MKFSLIFLLFTNLLFPNKNISISVFLTNAGQATSFQLVSFENLSKPVFDTIVTNSELHFDLSDTINSGVYRVYFSYLSTIKMKPCVEYFDVIIDSTEKEISLKYCLDGVNSFPEFLISEINRNWFDYIKLKQIKQDEFNRIENFISNKDLFFVSEKYKSKAEFLKILKNEISLLKNVFLDSNKNYWSSVMVIYMDKLNNIDSKTDESVFWDYFFSSDKRLLNTPIYEEILKKYLHVYYFDYNKYYKNEIK
uniref:hypothetical protein n=1 Tax=Flavobacterium sp. TaxID=239 RepID=UPI0037BF785A